MFSDTDSILGGKPIHDLPTHSLEQNTKGEKTKVMPDATTAEMLAKMNEESATSPSLPKQEATQVKPPPRPKAAAKKKAVVPAGQPSNPAPVNPSREKTEKRPLPQGEPAAVVSMGKNAKKGAVGTAQQLTQKQKEDAIALEKMLFSDLFLDRNLEEGAVGEKPEGPRDEMEEWRRKHAEEMELEKNRDDALQATRLEKAREVEFMVNQGLFHQIEIEDLELVAKIGGVNEWGLRKIQLSMEDPDDGDSQFREKFNFLDNQNRLLIRGKMSEWADDLSDFRKAKGAVVAHLDEPFAYFFRGEERKFINSRGTPLAKATIEKIDKFYETHWRGLLQKEAQPKVDEVVGGEDDLWGEPVRLDLDPEAEFQPILYYKEFSERLSFLSDRFADDSRVSGDLKALSETVRDFQHGSPEKGWSEVLAKIKKAVEDSPLPSGHKTRLFVELANDALHQSKGEVEKRDALFSIPELSHCPWIEYGLFDKGIVISFNDGGLVSYSLVGPDGKLLYPKEQSFDYIGPFHGEVALVKRECKWNFINKEGVVVGEEWFDGAFEPRFGLFRVNRAPNRWNYMNTKGQWLCESDFEDAKDFDGKRRAQVVLDGEEVFIDVNGELITSISPETVRVVGKFKEMVAKTSDREEIRRSMIAFIRQERTKGKPGMSESFHQLFHGLMKESPRQMGEWIRIFKECRKSLNAEVGLAKEGGVLDPSTVALGLAGKVVRLKVDMVGKQRLRHHVLDLCRREPVLWEEIQPLPVTLMALVQKMVEKNPNFEASAIRLMRDLERLVIRNAEVARKNLLGLYPKMHTMVLRSDLKLSMKEELVGLLLGLCGEKDIYLHWKSGGPTVDSYKPRTEEGKKIVEEIKEIRVKTNSSNETFMLHVRVEELCRMAKRGRVNEAFQSYQKLAQSNPKAGFIHRKMGMAFHEAGKRPRADRAECDRMALQALYEALALDMNDRVVLDTIAQVRHGGLPAPNVAEAGPTKVETKVVIEPSRRNVKLILGAILAFSAGAAVVQYRAEIKDLAIQAKQKMESILGDLGVIEKIQPQIELEAIPDSNEPPLVSRPAQKDSASSKSLEEALDYSQAIDRRMKEVLRKLEAEKKAKSKNR